MRAVKVEYTVRPEYVSTNKANIQKVMDELRPWEIQACYTQPILKKMAVVLCIFLFTGIQKNLISLLL